MDLLRPTSNFLPPCHFFFTHFIVVAARKHRTNFGGSSAAATAPPPSLCQPPARTVSCRTFFGDGVRRPPAIEKPDPPLSAVKVALVGDAPPMSEGNTRRAMRGSDGRARQMLRHLLAVRRRSHRRPPARPWRRATDRAAGAVV